MITVRKVLALPLLAALLGGCGSNFEWFPKGNGFTNNSTVTVPAITPGTVMREIPFPTSPVKVKAVHDLVFDRISGTFWLLAVLSGDASNAPDSLVQLTAAGDFVKTINQDAWPVSVNKGSNLAYDGSSFWITSHGQMNGVNASEVYRISSNGFYLGNKYACPATSTGFCQGLAWDNVTTSFWSASSDSARLVNYQVLNNAVTSEKPYANLWSGSGVTDVSFDSASGEVFVIKEGVIRVKGSNGTGLGTIAFSVPGSGKGDWDGTFFWVIDNGAQKMKALFIR